MHLFFLLKKHWQFVILVFLAVFFVALYSWLYQGGSQKFTSPDETANYFFIRQFSENTSLQPTEPLNPSVGGLVVPRSMVARGDKIVPGSFLGMVLVYGFLAKVFGVKLILYLTPFLSAVTVVFFYLLIKKIFSQSTAFISSLLLFVIPPFWFYSSRGMFHNIVFIDFFIIGLHFIVSAITSLSDVKRWLSIITAGLFVGLALIVRTSEIFWVLIVCIVIALLFRKKFYISQLLVFILLISVLFVPIFIYNHQLYGSIFSFAYTPYQSNSADFSSSLNTALLLKVRQVILPFGINFPQSITMAYKYLIQSFPWFSISLFLMLAWIIRKAIIIILTRYQFTASDQENLMPKSQVLYISLFVIISVWLIIYYGSFTFYEYINESQIILGSSYLRYWLPIFIFGLPLAVCGIKKISKMFAKMWLRKFIIPTYIALFILFSIFISLQDPLHGLMQLKENIRNENSIAEAVFQKTDTNSVIISGFADKVFFPERRVVVSLPTTTANTAYIVSQLLDSADLYLYFNPLDFQSSDIKERLSRQGFRFKEIVKFQGDNTVLFRIYSS